MEHSQPAEHLSGKLLVAMPGMGDPRFARSVILLCAHGDDGAMGLIVNKAAPQVSFTDLLNQLDIESRPGLRPHRVHFGGPVETGRGFVLHPGHYDAGNGTLKVSEDFAMTATLDILRALGRDEGPEAFLLALGYAGWSAGQLEREIGENGWLIADATPKIVFDTPDPHKWGAALRGIGVDPTLLSGAAGRA